MKKRRLPALLALGMALILCLGLAVPAMAAPAGEDPPEWNFLFAIIKYVDADCKDAKGAAAHTEYAMTQEEIDLVWANAEAFEEYMNQVGVMRAHVDVMELDTPLTELADSSYGSYADAKQTAPLLAGIDLDQYDQVFSVISLNVDMGYWGMTGSTFENGTGHSCVNFKNRDYALKNFAPKTADYPKGTFVHEFLHVMSHIGEKFGIWFELHSIRDDLYQSAADDWKSCYTDVILNRVNGDAETGTGVFPAAWQYSPRTLRAMSELAVPDGAVAIDDYAFQNRANLKRVTIPSGVVSIGYAAFYNCTALTEVTIPSGVTTIGKCAFQDCTSLTEVTIPSGVTSITTWTFGRCVSLTTVYIPASVTEIGYAAFWNTGLTDVYYGGTQAQWEAIQFDEFNSPLAMAAIHYNSAPASSAAFTDLHDWCAVEANWAADNGVAKGVGDNRFAPDSTCTNAQILTFLWRAENKPAAETASPFTVAPDYQGAIDWAYEQGMIDDFFAPGAYCTRANAVNFIWRTFDSEPPSAEGGSFTDVFASADYADAVAWAVEKGVTDGYGDTFRPNETCTRGQIVTFLYRAYVQPL